MFSEKSCKSKLDFIMDLPSWMHSPFQRSQNRVFGYYSLLTYILAFWCCGPDFVSTHQWQPPALRSFESVTPGVWEKKGWGEGLHVVDKLCIIHAYVKYIGRCTMVHGQKSLNRGTGHPFHNSNPQQFVFFAHYWSMTNYLFPMACMNHLGVDNLFLLHVQLVDSSLCEYFNLMFFKLQETPGWLYKLKNLEHLYT